MRLRVDGSRYSGGDGVAAENAAARASGRLVRVSRFLGCGHGAPVGRIRSRCVRPWLMLNRDGLTVLLHPETGDDYVDHTDHAAWFGSMLPLRLEMFKK
jgi:hypothetical protein